MYIFNWENVPGKDNGRLIEYLEQKYGVDWVRTGKIEKIGNDEIKIFTEKNFLSLILDNQKTNVILKINNVRTDEFNVKIENGNVNIYKRYPASLQKRSKTAKWLSLCCPGRTCNRGPNYRSLSGILWRPKRWNILPA